MDWFRWSDNPDANYIMIEPNVKYMITSYQALQRAPKPWYDRPPPTPDKAIRVDKMRFLPTRKLQNAFSSSPWVHTVGDDLDSFTYVFIHSLLFRGRQRGDPCTAGIRGYFSMLGNEHPKKIMDVRDSLENTLWIIGEDAKKARKQGEEPDGTAIAQFAEPLYKVTKVNVAHHSQERRLAGTQEGAEGAKERAATQYEEYLEAMVTLKESIDEGWARKEEEKRVKKAEKKARKAAEEAKEAEKASGATGEASGEGDITEDCTAGEDADDHTDEDAQELANLVPEASATEAEDTPMETDSEVAERSAAVTVSSPRVKELVGNDDGEPPLKRARVG